MPVVRRIVSITAALGAATFGPMAPTSSAATQAAWHGCASGDICIYNGLNGTGDVCTWDGNDIDWWTDDGSGSSQYLCSWTQPWDYRDGNVKSIWNRGTLDAGPANVKFYFRANYDGYYACAHGPTNGKPGFQGNTGPDQGAALRSHRWVSSC